MTTEFPEDLIPIGMEVKIGTCLIPVIICNYVEDIHSLGGWGYVMRWTDIKEAHFFTWTHGCDSRDTRIIQLHPLEQLGRQAE